VSDGCTECARLAAVGQTLLWRLNIVCILSQWHLGLNPQPTTVLQVCMHNACRVNQLPVLRLHYHC
jgi:hypothetical protein